MSRLQESPNPKRFLCRMRKLEPGTAWSYQATALGELASKSNSRRKTHWGGWIKSAKALTFEQSFLKQIPRPAKPFEGLVSLTAICYYASNRPDLDDTLLCDCLQKAGIIKNDRAIKQKHLFHGIDKKRPRVEFELSAITDSKPYT